LNEINKNIYNLENILPADISGWNGKSNIFCDLIRNIKPSIIVEVGTWKGQSAITMGECVKRLGINTEIYCIDTWLGALEFWTGPLSSSPERDLMLKNGYPSVYYQFISNVIHSNLQDIINPLPMTSLIGARYLKQNNKKADLIYIDASHCYEDVKSDIAAYYSLLSDSGKIFGDDYGDAWSGVVQAVDEFSKDNNLKLNIIDNFWIISKE